LHFAEMLINAAHIYTYWGGIMSSKNITLKVSTDTYAQYRDLCKKEGWIVSRQFEKLMEEQLEKWNKNLQNNGSL